MWMVTRETYAVIPSERSESRIRASHAVLWDSVDGRSRASASAGDSAGAGSLRSRVGNRRCGHSSVRVQDLRIGTHSDDRDCKDEADPVTDPSQSHNSGYATSASGLIGR
jgi:hypothetical protein